VILAEVVERDEVAAREVEDVDVIADRGAVFGGIVCSEFCEHAFAIGRPCMGDCGPTVAKHEQLISFANRDLREQREQVVGHALRVFAHDAAGVRAGGVEVAQQGGVPVVAGFACFLGVVALGFDVVADEIFDGGFGPAVGVGGADGAGFGNGDHVWKAGGVAVDGGGGGEDDVGDVVFGHGGEKVDGAVDIGAVVFQGDFTGFSYCLGDVSVMVKTCRRASEE